MLRERRARALKLLGRDSLGVTEKLGAHALRSRIYYVVMGPYKQRSFHRYYYYRANSVTHSVVFLLIFSLYCFIIRKER